MKKPIIVAALAVTLGGCASAGKGPSSYDLLYSQAQDEIRVAMQMGFLWSDTENLLLKSKQAQARGDKKRAKALAEQALKQAQLAQQQAREQANPEVVYPAL
jgi:pyrimidine deaminase RibD-like protein